MKQDGLNSVNICINCGAPIIPGSTFCESCGWKHGDQLPDLFEDYKDSPSIKRNPQNELRRRIRVFVPSVLLVAVFLIASVLLLFYKVIKPGILDYTEETMQEQADGQEVSEVLEQNLESLEATPVPTPVPTATPTPVPTATPTAVPTPEPTVAPIEPVAISYTWTDKSAIDMTYYPRFSMDHVISLTSTSEYVQENVSNGAEMVFDDNEKTSWQEGVEGDGIGQGILCQLNGEYAVRYLAFKLGNWRDDTYYAGNGRPRSLTITMDDDPFTIEFPEEKKEYVIQFQEEIPVSSIRVTIDSVYKGLSWDDTCITEFHVYGRMR